jgi:hypothetical protein
MLDAVVMQYFGWLDRGRSGRLCRISYGLRQLVPYPGWLMIGRRIAAKKKKEGGR